MTVVTPTGEAEVYKPPFNISGIDGPENHVPALGVDSTGLVERLLRRGGVG